MNLAWAAMGWGLVILAALAGWGRLVARAVFPAAAGWSLAGAWGIAVTVVLGGLVDAARGFSPAAVITYVVLGAVACAVQVGRDRASLRASFARGWRALRGDWLSWILLTLVVAIVSVRYASAPVRCSFHAQIDFQGLAFNMHDDFQSYLVMPERMLQTGQLGSDPFNTRQLQATLGGMHVLTVLARAVLPIEALHVMEDGVALLVFCGVLVALLRRLHMPPRGLLGLLLVAQCSFTHNLNLSSYLSGAAVLGAVTWLLLEADPAVLYSPRGSVALGLFLAGAAALKTTLIPPAGLLVALAVLTRLRLQPDRRVGRAAMIAAGVVVAGLLPWMLLKYRTYGTLLFPFLGKGHHWTSYYTPPDDAALGSWPIFLRENHHNLWGPAAALALAVALLAVPAWRKRLPAPEWATVVGGNLAWGVCTLAISLAGGGFDVSRYMWPLAVICVPLSLAVTWKLAGSFSAPSLRRATVLTWCLVLGAWLWLHQYYTTAYLFLAVKEDLTHAIHRHPIATPDLYDRARRLQESVPAGVPVLLRVEQPYLWDFRRNPLFVADWPGVVSPEPGMPLFKGAEALAAYLLAHEIRFVAYSYQREALFQYRFYAWRTQPDQPKWDRQDARLAFDFQNNLWELGFTRARLRDDGETVIIDLARRTGRLPPLRVN